MFMNFSLCVILICKLYIDILSRFITAYLLKAFESDLNSAAISSNYEKLVAVELYSFSSFFSRRGRQMFIVNVYSRYVLLITFSWIFANGASFGEMASLRCRYPGPGF